MTPIDVTEVQARVARAGLVFCLFFPATLFIAALLLKKSLPEPSLPAETANLIGYVFIAVAILDGLVALFIKRRLITPQRLAARFSLKREVFSHQLTTAYVPIFATCAAPALYALICFFLTRDIDTVVIISIISPACFLVVRPRANEIERLARDIFDADQNRDIRQ